MGKRTSAELLTIRTAMTAALAAYYDAVKAKDWLDAKKNRELFNDLHTEYHQGRKKEDADHAK